MDQAQQPPPPGLFSTAGFPAMPSLAYSFLYPNPLAPGLPFAAPLSFPVAGNAAGLPLAISALPGIPPPGLDIGHPPGQTADGQTSQQQDDDKDEQKLHQSGSPPADLSGSTRNKQQLSFKARHTHAAKGFPSSGSLISLAAAATPALGSLGSSSTALPLLVEAAAAAQLTTASSMSPQGGSPPGTIEFQYQVGQDGQLTIGQAAAGGLSIAPLNTDDLNGDYGKRNGDLRPPAPVHRPSARMRKVGSTTSLPGYNNSPKSSSQQHHDNDNQGPSSAQRHNQTTDMSRQASGRPASGLLDNSVDYSGASGQFSGSKRERPINNRQSMSGTVPAMGSGPLPTGTTKGLRSSRSVGGSMHRISSLQALVEVAAAAAEDTQGTNPNSHANKHSNGVVDSMSPEPDDDQEGVGEHMHIPLGMDESEMKRLKRKQSNRESARRSRLKKQAEADALSRATAELQAENGGLRAALSGYQSLLARLAAEKAELVAQVRSLGGDVPTSLEWQLPVIHIPPISTLQ